MVNDNGQAIDEKRDILAEIADKTRLRVAKDKECVSFETMKAQALAMEKGTFSFEKALQSKEMAFICEVKKASPSKGLIAPDFPYLQIAQAYEAAGASAISCLTEPEYFLGSDQYLQEITSAVTIPVLRKDFFVDAYMVYQAKVLGASAVLLICAILNDDELADYFAIANDLGLSAIFEAHDETEVRRAAACGARIIGVNNRNLKTFALDLQNSIDLRNLVGDDTLFISESGIKTRDDIVRLERHNISAVLIGETLMRSDNKTVELNRLKGLPKVKLCGLSRPEDVETANKLHPEYVGFLFAKSRRQVTQDQAKLLRSTLNSEISTVGVFVNAGLELVERLVQQSIIDVVQLHGQEDEDYLQMVKKACPDTPIWKAVTVTKDVDFTQWQSADCFVLDNGAGGTGEVFDWSLLPTLAIPKPYFLAGGLSPDNVTQALEFAPYGVDVSGGIETDGKKDSKKMQLFTKKVRGL